ncbi:condensation domain-containing protein [Gordonia sp. HY285]|uniref:condensation domain-containing protein n=1 Tax=Gordonia liuliyuniae TaxID=2911517 RepID=UPI001F42EFA2|nr:condensation domain-containing protein [Gordonia liuliyuniae]MCF8609748.1 condensation domain-containing protein [Gordonia liuliyuniae]
MSILNDTQRELMRRRLAAAGIDAPVEDTASAPSEPAAADGTLGIAERRMWKIYEIDPTSDSHNFAVHLTFGAPYTLERLVESMAKLIASSEVVGSVIDVTDDGPRRRPAPRVGRWTVPGRVWEFGDIAADVDASARVVAQAPFELTREQPWRVRVRTLADGTVSVILVIHHIGGDETILPPVLTALVSGRAASWSGGGTAVDPSTRTGVHADAAVRHAQSTWAADGVRYPLSGELPSTTPEESWVSVMGEGRGALLHRRLPDEVVARLIGFARTVDATPNSLFVAVSALTVYAVTGTADFVILVPADNRAPAETVDRVGYSGNIVPMRFTFDPAAMVGDAVRSAVATVFESMEHSSVDYGTILTALRGSGGRFPVAEIMTLVKNAPLRGVRVPDGARVTCETVFKDVVHYPLSISFEFDEHDAVHLELEHRTDVLDGAYAERVADVVDTLTSRLPDSADVPLAQFVG